MADRKPLLTPEAAAFVRGTEAPAAAPQEPVEEARVRFTCDLPKSLHKRLKQRALDQDQSMSELVRGALSEWLQGRS